MDYKVSLHKTTRRLDIVTLLIKIFSWVNVYIWILDFKI